jgi:hypothetical protein
VFFVNLLVSSPVLSVGAPVAWAWESPGHGIFFVPTGTEPGITDTRPVAGGAGAGVPVVVGAGAGAGRENRFFAPIPKVFIGGSAIFLSSFRTLNSYRIVSVGPAPFNGAHDDVRRIPIPIRKMWVFLHGLERPLENGAPNHLGHAG